MQFDTTKSAKVKNGVGLAFTLSYPETPTAGQYNQVRLSVDNPLENYDDGTQAAVSDFEISIEETSSPPSGITKYNVDDTESVKPGRNNSKPNLDGWIERLIEDTAKFGVNQTNPIFSVFIGAILELAKESNCIREQNGEISIRDTPISSRRTKVKTEQRSQVFEILTGLMLVSRASQGKVGGSADYNIEVSADTHNVSSRIGRTGIVNRTGSISIQSQFSIDWQ